MELFTPVKIGNVEIKNRIMMAAMGHGLASDGFVTDIMQAYFVARARGGAGLIVTGGTWVVQCTGVSPATTTHPNLYDDKFISGFAKLTEEVHRYGAKIACQLSHLGRQINSEEFGRQPVAPSAIPCPVCKEIPRELPQEEIAEIVEAHAKAVLRARKAGFDIVEFQGCHGYLISEFLSPHANQRRDEYGGSLENRARFYVEIIKRSKQLAGDDFPLICRYNGEDYIKNGLILNESIMIGRLLEKAGADALHITASVYGSNISTVPMNEVPGCFTYLAQAIKERVNIPVITVGKIYEPQMAEDIIRQKRADLVALGRALLADPEWPNKAQSGKFEEIRKCVHCNQGCIDHITEMQWQGIPLKITCLVNPECGRELEAEIIQTQIPKKVLVVGGGPAGLEAAVIAAKRGHNVTLYEKEAQMGGQFLLASIPPAKQELKEAILFLSREATRWDVQIEKGMEFKMDLLEALKPDLVILATGALSISFPLKGKRKGNVVNAVDVLAGRVPVGMNILVVGGGSVGLETADYLADRGKKVKVIEMLGHFAPDMGRIARFDLRKRLDKNGVELKKNCRLEEILDEGIKVSSGGKSEILKGVDTIVLALGSKPNDELVQQIKEKVKELYVIGGASKPLRAIDAIYEGWEVGKKI